MRLLESRRQVLAVSVSLAVSLLAGASSALFGVCGPFTDVTDAAFCPFVLEIFTLGITTGTTPTTYDPTSSVSRLQMAAFLSRTVDGALKRGSRDAALDRFWTTQGGASLALTTVGASPQGVRSDGADLWVANGTSNSVSRVRGSDGKLLETWTGATGASGVVIAMGRVLVSSGFTPRLFQIDPSQTAGAVTTVATNAGNGEGIAFDGTLVWTASPGGSIALVTPGASIPWTVTTVTTGFTNPEGVLYDGTNVWVTDSVGTLLKLDASGAVLQTVTLSGNPRHPAFDGTNIWVPLLNGAAVSVVRASSGSVLATLTGNGLSVSPFAAAFDGQRVLVTGTTNSVTLYKAADLTWLGTYPTGGGTLPLGACSDGVNFWVTFTTSGQLARF